MLCRLGIGQGVLLKQVMSLTSNFFGCGTPSRRECLVHLKALSSELLKMYLQWVEGYCWFFVALFIWYYCPTLLSSFSLATIFAENGLHCEAVFGCINTCVFGCFGSLQQSIIPLLASHLRSGCFTSTKFNSLKAWIGWSALSAQLVSIHVMLMATWSCIVTTHQEGNFLLSMWIIYSKSYFASFCVKLELECHKCNMPNNYCIFFKCLTIYFIIIVCYQWYLS